MDSFIIWAIISAITSGLYNFGFKIITKENYSTYHSTIYSYSVAAIISFGFLLFDGFSGLQDINLVLLLALAFGNILFFYISVLTRVKSMQNIDNVIFYPLYKTIAPILVTMISLFYFRESLTLLEGLGILIGITIPLLLLSKAESLRQTNLKLGLVFMLITAIVGSIAPIFVKLSNEYGFDTMTYVFLSFLMGILFSVAGHKFENKKGKIYNKDGILKFGIIIGVLHFLTFYSYVKAFEGNIAIAFTINSFSLLIPIILSVVFYNEHFSIRKAIVIALSIISILLFI